MQNLFTLYRDQGMEYEATLIGQNHLNSFFIVWFMLHYSKYIDSISCIGRINHG